MDKRKSWRVGFAWLSFVCLPVMTINIENFVEFFGLDKVLIKLAEVIPNWLSGIWVFVTSDTALLIAIAVTTYTAGLWTETWFRRLAIGRNKPLDKNALADDCQRLSEVIFANAKFFGSEDNTYLVFVRSELWKVEDVFRKKLNTIIDLHFDGQDEAILTSDLLSKLVQPIRDGDTDKIQRLVAFSEDATNNQMPQLPQNTNSEAP